MADQTAADEDIEKGLISAVLIIIIVSIINPKSNRIADKPLFKLDSGSSLFVDKLSSRCVTISFHRNWKYTGSCQRRSNARKVGCVAIAREARVDGARYWRERMND
jgi:hypothetical protein